MGPARWYGPAVPLPSDPSPVIATISGYEVFVVVLAVAALVVLVGSAVLGIWVRLVRGVTDEPPDRRRRGRRGRRSPGAG